MTEKTRPAYCAWPNPCHNIEDWKRLMDTIGFPEASSLCTMCPMDRRNWKNMTWDCAYMIGEFFKGGISCAVGNHWPWHCEACRSYSKAKKLAQENEMCPYCKFDIIGCIFCEFEPKELEENEQEQEE